MARDDRPQRLLLLQGPPGPLFYKLAQHLEALGVGTVRINLGGGDDFDWPGPAINFSGRFVQWDAFLADVVDREGITDVLLFGDCRPYHVVARQVAKTRGVHIHVLEEGYIRPDWMTLERDGVNTNSSLPRDPQWLLAEAAKLTPPPPLPPVTASFGRRARDGSWYYAHHTLRKWRFPHFRSHRPVNVFFEWFGWGWRLLRQSTWRRQARRTTEELADTPFFLFPLQLSTDYQIREHSPFPDMPTAARHVIASFARAGLSRDTHLVLAIHPLDVSMIPWRRHAKAWAREFALEGQIDVVDGANLETLIEMSEAFVCVNSTSATLALKNGTPVCAIGEAIYDIDRLTWQYGLEAFWTEHTPPDPAVFAAFRAVLLDRCLVRGGTASMSAVNALIPELAARLTRSRVTAVATSRAIHQPARSGHPTIAV